MVIKKGTVAIVNYRVYEDSTRRDCDWVEVDDHVQSIEGLALVDERKTLRFRFGMKDIHCEIEKHLSEGKARVVLRNHNLVYDVELCPETDQPMSMTPDEIFNELAQLKQLGNEFMRTGAVVDALNTYSEAIQLLTSPDFNRRTERDVREIFIPLYLNKALCCLKTDRIGDAIECCNNVLEVDPKNVKGLYRRALAKLENKQTGSAKRDLLSASSLDPENFEVEQKLRQVTALEKSAIDQQERSMYIKMIQNTHRSTAEIWFEIGEHSPPKKLVIELFDEIVPRTVDNFKRLVDRYAGCSVFKIGKDQFLQTGDYEFNDGSGGNAATADRVVRERSFMNDEWLLGKHLGRGVVGMCNYGPNTVASQFYITLGPCPELEGKHVVFGQVIDGFDALDDINNLAPLDGLIDFKPIVPIKISKIDIVG